MWHQGLIEDATPLPCLSAVCDEAVPGERTQTGLLTWTGAGRLRSGRRERDERAAGPVLLWSEFKGGAALCLSCVSAASPALPCAPKERAPLAMLSSTPIQTSGAARASRAPRASPSSCSPTRLSRLQEKEDLRQLNDRLANYIERVRQLENDKSSMQLRLEEKEETTTRELRSVRELYEKELADARKTLDSTANDRARLQIEYSQLSEDHRKLVAR